MVPCSLCEATPLSARCTRCVIKEHEYTDCNFKPKEQYREIVENVIAKEKKEVEEYFENLWTKSK